MEIVFRIGKWLRETTGDSFVLGSWGQVPCHHLGPLYCKGSTVGTGTIECTEVKYVALN